MNAQLSSERSSKARDLLKRNQDLLRNAGSLAATTGLTSLFGFVFTIVATKLFPGQELGFGTAAINAMQLFAVLGMFGLGTMLIGELPKMHRDRGGLFAAAMSTSFIGSVILGLGFAVVVGLYFGSKLPGIGGDVGEVLLFVAGTALTGATLVFDEGVIGVLRGGVQLWRNLAMSAIKLAALPLAAFLLHDKFGIGISLAFVIGTAGSMIPASLMLMRGGSRVFHRPDWKRMRELFPVALSHNWLNLATQAPSRVIPIVVTAVVGGTGGGIFYIVWMIAALLFMVPVHLGTVLFALASASPDVVAEKLRFVLRISMLIGLPVMVALAIGAHFLLGYGYGPQDAAMGTVPLWLLIIGYIPQMASAQYIAVSRATGKVGRAAGLLVTFALIQVIAVYIGGKMYGLDGLSFAYLGVLIIQGLVTAPTVLKAAYAHTTGATGSLPVISAVAPATGAMPAPSGPLARVTGELIRLTGAIPVQPGSPDRQESGIAALFAIATAAVASDGNTMNMATEIWRTGSFPAVPPDAGGSWRSAAAAPATGFDVYGGGRAPATMQSPAMAQTPQDQASYQRRQQAGIDALLAIATPAMPAEGRQEEPQR